MKGDHHQLNSGTLTHQRSPLVITIVIVEFSSSFSLRGFFPFWVFHVSSVYLWLFSVIWLYTLYYFGAWIHSLRIYPQHLVFSLRSWILTHDLSLIQHPVAPTDLHFKLNKMLSKVTVSYKDPESVQADSSRKCTIGHRAPTSKEDAPTTTMKTEDSMTFTPLKLSIDQIFNIIKHQP